MKKVFVFFLCAALLCMVAACAAKNTTDTPTDASASTSTEAPTQTPTEEPVSPAIRYKGLESAAFTTEEMSAAEGREPDFTTEQGGTTIYVYNNVTMDDLTFTQVQYTYLDNCNRISCTYTADDGLDAVLEQFRSAMTALYGEPSVNSDTEPSIWTWHDQTANYAMLTRLNDTTVQLAFYLCEGAK